MLFKLEIARLASSAYGIMISFIRIAIKLRLEFFYRIYRNVLQLLSTYFNINPSFLIFLCALKIEKKKFRPATPSQWGGQKAENMQSDKLNL